MTQAFYGYMGYENLSYEESSVIINFFGDSEIFNEEMDGLLQSDSPLSKDMRRFIADVFAGRIMRKKVGRPSNTQRDKEIYYEIEYLLSSGMNLTSSKHGNSAVVDVAEWLELTEEVVLKAYQKIKNGDGYDNPIYCSTLKIYDDNGVI